MTLKGYLLTVAGLICFFEGLPYLAAPDPLKRWLLKVCTLPSSYLRFLGGSLMALGFVLVYLGRRFGG
ncbi:MAG: DUF2065 domain-containing protein [Syntrophobacteraceae bacterium]|nr:DUF2065 domain-containing protein [Syntrophobacteraceae bacterium]